jgi:hypothetical protein
MPESIGSSIPNSVLYSSVYKGFIAATILTFVIGMGSSPRIAINCFQVGYCIFLIAILMILINVFNKILEPNSTKSGFTIVLNVSPFIVICVIVAFLVYFNMKYYDIIVENHVSSGYFIFSNIALILLMIQLFVIYSSVSEERFETDGISNTMSGMILLLGVLTGISANIIYQILHYFTTDGFSVIKV